MRVKNVVQTRQRKSLDFLKVTIQIKTIVGE